MNNSFVKKFLSIFIFFWNKHETEDASEGLVVPFGHLYDLESDKNRAQCNNCGKSYSAPRGTTSGLLKHLESHSKEDAQECREDSKRKNGPSSSSASVTEPKQKQPKLDMFIPRNNENTQKLLDQAIVQFPAESGVAFRVTDLDSFRQFRQNF